jgi:hypothetical protein
VAAGNAADDTGNVGAHYVVVQGLDTGGHAIEETIRCYGAAAGPYSEKEFWRVHRAYVFQSGTYSDTGTASHVQRIVMSDSGSRTWAIIDSGDHPVGQSEIAAYSVPRGQTAYISGFHLSVDAARSTDFHLMVREDADDRISGFGTTRLKHRTVGLQAPLQYQPQTPFGPFSGPCDIYWMARADQAGAEVSADMEILIYKDNNDI